jgi:hypothetical protein
MTQEKMSTEDRIAAPVAKIHEENDVIDSLFTWFYDHCCHHSDVITRMKSIDNQSIAENERERAWWNETINEIDGHQHSELIFHASFFAHMCYRLVSPFGSFASSSQSSK